MMEELALVLDRQAAEHGRVWVQTRRRSACEGCQLSASCAQKTLVGLLGRESGQKWQIANSLRAVPGDVVVLRVPETELLKASSILYGLPVLSLVLGAVTGALMVPDLELGSAIGALAGLLLGLGLASVWARLPAQQTDFQPVMDRFAGLARSGPQHADRVDCGRAIE
jgi:sigma-E factor negative regulatory protein RseC